MAIVHCNDNENDTEDADNDKNISGVGWYAKETPTVETVIVITVRCNRTKGNKKHQKYT